MLLEHEGRRPTIHASAYVAPNATVSGDVTIGPESRILFGAVLTAEGGPDAVAGRPFVIAAEVDGGHGVLLAVAAAAPGGGGDAEQAPQQMADAVTFAIESPYPRPEEALEGVWP